MVDVLCNVMAKGYADISKKMQGTVVIEQTPELSIARENILPMVKTLKWLKDAKEVLLKNPKRSAIVSKSIGTTEFATTYVLHDESMKMCRYISQNDLKIWKLKEKELISIALANLRHLVEEKSRGRGNPFDETQTGLLCYSKLGNFSASIILLQDVLKTIEIPEKDRVYQIPKSDLVFVAKSTDAMATCIMGDVSTRFIGANSFLGLQPVRYRNGWMPYEHNKVDHQCPVPVNKDEIKIFRKAIFRN